MTRVLVVDDDPALRESAVSALEKTGYRDLIARVAAAARRSEPERAEIEPAPPPRMIGSHPSMIEMYKAITRVASAGVPVLILGESGSGKSSLHSPFTTSAAAPAVPSCRSTAARGSRHAARGGAVRHPARRLHRFTAGPPWRPVASRRRNAVPR